MSIANGGIGGPGVGLPYPTLLYPSSLGLTAAVAEVAGSNIVSLAAGQSITLPRGQWAVHLTPYTFVQWHDPVTTGWRNITAFGQSFVQVISDGVNYRVMNETSCVIGAVITNGGTAAYAQATTSVTPSAGNSTWQPIIGGQLSTTAVISSAGSGYGMPPLLYVNAPPSPGIPFSAVAAITNGTVSSVTVLNQGAGYTAAPSVLVLPNPYDPNLLAGSAITAAVITTSLVAASGTASAGKLTGLICTNPGATIASVPTLTVAGAGASAAATAVPLWTATGLTITGAGGGCVANNEVTSVGGVPTATAAWTNPDFEFTNFVPRKASILAAIATATVASVSAIYDGGLFTGTPNCMYLQNGVAATTSPTLTFALGGTNSSVFIQPAG